VGSGYGGLIVGLGIMFLIGFIVPLIISPFVEEGSYNHDSFISPLVDTLSVGPFAIDSNILSFMTTQLEAFTYIPDLVAIPLLILSLVLIIYSLIPLV
jgi:hypothetical protein